MTYSQPFRGKNLAMKAQHAGAGAWEFAADRAGAHLLDLVDQGWELLEEGDLPQASKAFRKVITAEPDLIDAHVGLAKIEWERGRLKAARRHYEQAVDIGLRALPTPFEGTLPWDLTVNRPFLRALHGSRSDATGDGRAGGR